MHLGNGAITPECIVLTAAGAAAGLGLAAASLRRERPSREQVLLSAGLGSLVFAAQAINIPVWPGISGHLVGGALLAWFAGPSLAVWTMAIVLALQAMLLGDGGLAALGANVLNMAILPAALVAASRRIGRAQRVRSASENALLGVAAALSIPVAAALILVETAAFRPAGELGGWSHFSVQLIGTHLWIGVLEAAVSIAAAAALSASLAAFGRHAAWKPAATCVAFAVAIVALALPFGSELPDGYEAAAEATGQHGLLTEEAATLAQTGTFNGAAQSAQNELLSLVRQIAPGEWAVMLVATLLAAAILVAAAGFWLPAAPARATATALDA